MPELITIAAQLREKVGKGSSRAARRAGLVPAVVYGGGRETASITIDARILVRHLSAGGFANTLFELVAGDKKQQVLPRDVQLDPVTDRPMHVDFLRVAEDTRVTIQIPVTWLDEELSPGLARGGVLNVVRHQIEVLCPATAIPDTFEISLEGLEIGDAVHVSAIDLPEGVTLTVTDRDFTIVTVAAPSEVIEEEEEEEEEGEFVEGEEGEVAEGEEGEEGEKPAEGGPEAKSE